MRPNRPHAKFQNAHSKPSRDSRPQSSGGGRSSAAKSSSPKPFDVPKTWRLVAGTHALKEMFHTKKASIQKLILKEGFESAADLRELEELAQQHRVHIEKKPATVMDKYYANHQGALAYAAARPTLDFAKLAAKKHSILLALDGLEDPHNLGALMRTAWLTGVDGILLSADRSVGLTPTVHKVACGGVEHVPVEEMTQFATTFEKLKEAGYWVFGLSHKSERTLFQTKLPEKIIWVVGSEEKGLRSSTERVCDELVKLPQLSDAASYNASVAGAMALSETVRQHRHPTL